MTARPRRSLIEAIVEPFRFATRRLIRNPGFFVLSSGSLAIALGATAAAFGFADAWKHPISPLSAPDRVAWVGMWGGPDQQHGGLDSRTRWSFIERTEAFESVAFTKPQWLVIRVGEEAFRDEVLAVTENFTTVAGIKPRLGRSFLPGDTDRGAVLISDYLWHRFFGNREAIGDARLSIGEESYQVIGVLPSWSGSPIAAGVFRRMTSIEQAQPAWPVIRVKPTTTLAVAQAQLDAAAKVMNARNTDASRPYGFSLHSLERRGSPSLSGLHMLMNFIAIFVLVIACANVSALLLARAAARRRDLALHLSLGAGRRALVADVFAELTVVAVVGLAIGLLLANASTGLVRSLIPEDWLWQALVELRWSWRVFAQSAGALLFVLIAAGSLPAIQVSRIPPMEPLKDSSGGATGRQPQRMKSVVMLQLAIALMMLVVTSLLAKGVAEASAAEFGYDARMVTVATGNFVYRENTAQLAGQTPTEYLLPIAMNTAGVSSASWYSKGVSDGFQVISDDVARDARPLLVEQYTIAGPRFMETIGVPILEGRDFAPGDSVGDGAVILDDSAAAALFPTGSAVGRRIKLGRRNGKEPWRPVIGVVRSIRTRFPPAPVRYPSVYVATSFQKDQVGAILARSFAIVARSDKPDNGPMMAVRIRRELTSILPVNVNLHVNTLSAAHEAAIASQKQFAGIFASLALGALIFAAAGLFAVLSFMVSHRMREFGIRVAIGADQRDVARLVLRDAFELALGGTAIGGAAGVALTLVMWAPQFGVNAMSWVALVIAELVLIAVVMLASLAPALRATKADPVDVLRAS
jgi:putative ABC transport system permease protein